jgi:hypothetical protein
MTAFRAAVEARDLAAMEAALSPDVVFRSPVVHKPYEGREPTMHLLGHIIEVLEDFRYTDELRGEGTHALVFRARVGDKELEGLDHLTIGPDGLVTQLVVMLRPLSGLAAAAQAMGERLERSPVPQ